MKIEKYFRTRKGAFKTILWAYLFGLGFLFIGLSYHREFRKYGHFTTPIDLINEIGISGNDASFTIYGVIVVASALVLYASWLTAAYAFFEKRSDFTRNPNAPENVICTKCLEAFTGDTIKDMACPKCGGAVEDLDGFFERHPDFVGKDKDSAG